jgi:hypothetical protein
MDAGRKGANNINTVTIPWAGEITVDVVGGPFCTGDEPIDRRSIKISVLADGAPP